MQTLVHGDIRGYLVAYSTFPTSLTVASRSFEASYHTPSGRICTRYACTECLLWHICNV